MQKLLTNLEALEEVSRYRNCFYSIYAGDTCFVTMDPVHNCKNIENSLKKFPVDFKRQSLRVSYGSMAYHSCATESCMSLTSVLPILNAPSLGKVTCICAEPPGCVLSWRFKFLNNTTTKYIVTRKMDGAE